MRTILLVILLSMIACKLEGADEARQRAITAAEFLRIDKAECSSGQYRSGCGVGTGESICTGIKDGKPIMIRCDETSCTRLEPIP